MGPVIKGTSVALLLQYISILLPKTTATGKLYQPIGNEESTMSKKDIAMFTILFDIVKPNMDEYGYPNTHFRFRTSDSLVKDHTLAAKNYLELLKGVIGLMC